MEVESQKSSPGHHVLGECLFSFGDYGMHGFRCSLLPDGTYIFRIFFGFKVAKFSQKSTFQETEGTTLQGIKLDSFWFHPWGFHRKNWESCEVGPYDHL